jgi:hypothetical protein
MFYQRLLALAMIASSKKPAYLNAIFDNKVHVVTVNDYLASRDAEWMGKIFSFLGLTVGTSISGMSGEEKQYQLMFCSSMSIINNVLSKVIGLALAMIASSKNIAAR